MKRVSSRLILLPLVSGVRQGTLTMENCVLQCETTGVIVRTAAHFTMNMCDLYGSKVSACASRWESQRDKEKID